MNSPGQFPNVRPRRLRYNSIILSLVRETQLRTERLILPLFVRHGEGIRKPISSMPGNDQLSIRYAR